jgi:hypothetical protein
LEGAVPTTLVNHLTQAATDVIAAEHRYTEDVPIKLRDIMLELTAGSGRLFDAAYIIERRLGLNGHGGR